MKLIANEKIAIERKPEDVFAYVCNMENFGGWFEGVISIESANESEHGHIGKEYLETVNVPFRGERKIGLAVVESERPTRFVTEGKFPPMLPRMEIQIEANGSGSVLSWTMYSRNKNPVFGLLLLPIARSILSKRAKLSLSRLKSKLEQGPQPA